jgi:hypothetical protein
MKVNITIKYLGKSANLDVDFDDELLVDETYEFARQYNLDTIMNHFYDNIQVDVEVLK